VIQRIKRIKPQSWFGLLCGILNIFLIFSLCSPLLAFTRVSGTSMLPTLEDGDFYVSTTYFEIRPGDIVIADSEAMDTKIIKRVVGVPGDTISIDNGTLFRNHVALTEDYIAEPMDTPNISPFTLEEDMYYLMGDNRNKSADSRMIGPVPRSEISYVVHLLPLPVTCLLVLAYAVSLSFIILKLTDIESNLLFRLWSKRRKKAAEASETES